VDELQLAPAPTSRHWAVPSEREIMNCSAKQLNGISLPNGWTVRVIYRDGSLRKTFTIEELKDIEEQIDLRSDWVTISVNRSCEARNPNASAGAYTERSS
jgi:hypothetical protein